jgi:CheY-like chemotaxis protein
MPTQAGAILVVDDNALNREMLIVQLEIEGHIVTAAERGDQALALARAPSTSYCSIL